MVWGFGQITNQSKELLFFDYAVGSGAATQGGQLNTSCGDAELDVGALGAIYFTDVGHVTGYPHYWGVQVQWDDATVIWSYDGGGSLDVQVAPDGSFTLSGQGQSINGRFSGPTAMPPVRAQAEPPP